MKNTTIFKQLILNIVIPAVLALLILGILNFTHTRNILVESAQERNHIISDEITHILEFQDVALNLLDESLDKKLREYSHKLVHKYFKNTNNIENADLYKILDELGMHANFEDIYVINSEGIVVNTTFVKDLGLNFFSFGEEHKNHLLHVLSGEDFVSERFAIEASTRRLKKYTYQPTLDGKYIIELGLYSTKADDIIQFIRNTLAELSEKQKSVENVDLFIWADKPISLNKESIVTESHMDTLTRIFSDKDTSLFPATIDGKRLNFEYIYMDRENTDLYKGSVIRIVTDKTHENRMLRNELFKFFIIF